MPDETIAVLGSEPEVFFDAQRRSATGYIYTYGLMEAQPLAESMQEEMINEVERSKPRFIVVVDVRFSWLYGPASKFLFRIGPIGISAKTMTWWVLWSNRRTKNRSNTGMKREAHSRCNSQ